MLFARPAVTYLDRISRFVFVLLSMALMALAAGLLIHAGMQMAALLHAGEPDLGATLLAAIGYTVIALAVFEVSKYLMEEEVVRPSEMRYTGEARRGMTKFISTIAIAIFLEALVLVFAVGKKDPTLMLYPTLLLFAGVTLVVGLGIYQRLSASAEKDVGGIRGEARAEAEAEAEAEAARTAAAGRKSRAGAEAADPPVR
ncbi:MAG: GNAT family acetyltransferase [Alphaproteobacteria bacterium]